MDIGFRFTYQLSEPTFFSFFSVFDIFHLHTDTEANSNKCGEVWKPNLTWFQSRFIGNWIFGITWHGVSKHVFSQTPKHVFSQTRSSREYVFKLLFYYKLYVPVQETRPGFVAWYKSKNAYYLQELLQFPGPRWPFLHPTKRCGDELDLANPITGCWCQVNWRDKISV